MGFTVPDGVMAGYEAIKALDARGELLNGQDRGKRCSVAGGNNQDHKQPHNQHKPT